MGNVSQPFALGNSASALVGKTDASLVEVSLQERDRWDQFVSEVDGGTIYHTTDWCDIIAGCYHFRPVLLGRAGASGSLDGVLPLFEINSPISGRRLVSLPYTNTAGPLCRTTADEVPLLRAAVDRARERQCRYLEIRGPQGANSPERPQLQRHDYFGSFVLELQSDPERLRQRYDKRVRRGIAKADKSAMRVVFAEDSSAARAFYRLNLETRRKHGVPPQSLAFFDKLWTTLRPRGRIEIAMAEWQGRVVAGIVLLAYNDTVTYAYGASDQRFQRYAPNHALFDVAIGWAAERGYRQFDFGRTAPDNHGLMEFKRQWGATFVPLPYYYWPSRGGFVTESENGWKHRLFTSAWRRLPLAATAVLGPALYRHMA